MVDMLKNNKKLLIILGVVIVLIIIVLLLFGRKGNRRLVLSCSMQRENEYISMLRNVEVYKNGKTLIFKDEIEGNPLTDDDKVNNNIDVLFQIYGYDKLNYGVLSYKKDGKKLEIDLNVDFSKYSDDEITFFIGTSARTVQDLKNYLEAGGLKCVEY